MSIASSRPWDVLDTGWLRVCGHLALMLCCLGAWSRERRGGSRSADRWPPFWLTTFAVVAVLCLGRILELDSLVTDLGRSQARLAGWYRTRRGVQAVLVGGVATAWAIAVLTAIWRVPERRRRYLPTALVIVTMVCFAAVRLVSLHQVDSVLYRREVAGIRGVAVIEWLLLATAALSIVWHPFQGPASERPLSDPGERHLHAPERGEAAVTVDR